MPGDQNLPVNQKTGAPLYLLAQINFEQIPHIKDFPEKGLLQIFISGDDGVYGINTFFSGFNIFALSPINSTPAKTIRSASVWLATLAR